MKAEPQTRKIIHYTCDCCDDAELFIYNDSDPEKMGWYIEQEYDITTGSLDHIVAYCESCK